MITDAMIVRESGQYDKEVIQSLRLERLSIYKLSNLEGCTALLELSLPYNEISIIAGLDSLTTLRRLNLSFNHIRTIENLASLVALEVLDLRANSIEKIDSITELSGLEMLKSLYLRGTDGEDSNPVCGRPEYTNSIIRALPQLHIMGKWQGRRNYILNRAGLIKEPRYDVMA